jgi:hypothetical protein
MFTELGTELIFPTFYLSSHEQINDKNLLDCEWDAIKYDNNYFR